MTCRETQAQLEAFLNGKLSGESSRSIRRHLASCNSCAALLSPEDLIELLPVLDETIQPSAGLQARFHARMEAHRREQPEKTRRTLPFDWRALGRPARLIGAGALATVLVAAGIIFEIRSYRPYATAPSEVEMTIAGNLPLLQDLRVIENLEMLEDFDSIDNLSTVPGSSGLR